MKNPEKLLVSILDISILEAMRRQYEKRGVGYSQKEALKLAIKALKTQDSWEKYIVWKLEKMKFPKFTLKTSEQLNLKIDTLIKEIKKGRKVKCVNSLVLIQTEKVSFIILIGN